MSHLADRILGLHGWVALAVIFAVPALESSAFLGFVFPGEVAVLLGGVLAYQHKVPLAGALGAAVAGAVIGDTIGYEVGKHVGRRLLDGTIGRFVKRDHLDRAERYLATKGGKAVLFGRFTAALRVLIPGLAGMSGMHYPTFAAYNVAGGVVWATGFVLLGYLGGSSYRRMESIAKRASLLLLLGALLIGTVVVLARWVAHHPDRVRAFADRQFDRPRVAAIRGRYRRQIDFLVRRLRPRRALGLSLTVSLGVLAVAGAAFGVITQDVMANESLNPVDRPFLRFLARHREPWLTTVNRVVTELGSSVVLVPLVLLAGTVWWWRRRTWRPLLLLAVAYLGAVVTYQPIKHLVGRARPPIELAVAHYSGPAFPSGHATQSAAVWGMLAALVAASTPRWGRKVAAWATALVIVVLVGASRAYLGAHWLTDVVAGWTLGALWLFSVLVTVHVVGGLRGNSSSGRRRSTSASGETMSRSHS